MAEAAGSLLEYREPPTLDSDGEATKPPPRRCLSVRKQRKGIPMKVPERLITEDEDSLSEHSDAYSSTQCVRGLYPEAVGVQDTPLPPGELPYYLPDPLSSDMCVPELVEEDVGLMVQGGLYRTPNCRVREVHCGSQARLCVFAIRDIAKGEEITVDYGLGDWSSSLNFHSMVSPVGYDCGSDLDNDLKKDGPVRGVAQYLPSWSLSPSSSTSHSEHSAADVDDEDTGDTPDPPAPPAPARRAPSSRRHRCVFCGRRFRKIARHLQRAHAGETRGAPGRARGSRDWVLRDRGDTHTPPPPPPECGPCWSGPTPPGRHQRSSSSSRQRGPLYTAREEEQPQQEEERPAAGRRSVKEGGQGQDRQTSSSVLPRSDAVSDLKDLGEPCSPPSSPSLCSAPQGSKPHVLPLLSDLSSLHAQLQQRQERARQALLDPQQRLSTGLAETWRSLCHSSLALLILFNRRRDCEVSKLRVSSYCQRRRAESEATEERQAPMGQELSLLDRERPLCDRSRRKVLGVSAAAAPPAGREEDLALEAALSPFEREVLCDLTRAKVQGKRGKVVPLLLTAEMESSLDLLLSTRDQVGVSPDNPYVFARPFHSAATPLRGGDLLRLLARSCGARRPQSLTCTRLRRQVAILSQLLSLCGRAQRSRLEGYLRREYHVTQDCTRLQEDPGLMGRVARVVLAGEKDGLMFKGMTLEQICLELDVLSENSADALSEDEQEQEEEEEEVTRKQKRASSSSSQKPLPSAALPQSQQRQRRPPRAPPSLQMTSPSPSPSARNSSKRTGAQPRQGKRGVLKRPWSEAERRAVEEHLEKNIRLLRVPAKAECERCLAHCPLLGANSRDWRAVKFYVHNRIQLIKRHLQRSGLKS
ncbi:uncharacterized protein [Lepisosteus oculatus]|uniref:uncharacterized protein n=1 Tax=Lepisosteus oculatus TaxID=7918 RepID=UPI00371F8C84